jgi:hypothetical protein
MISPSSTAQALKMQMLTRCLDCLKRVQQIKLVHGWIMMKLFCMLM